MKLAHLTTGANHAENIGFTGLSRASGAIRPGYFFIFLAHDPLFGEPDYFPPADPELSKLNRELVLYALENIFIWATSRMKDIEALSQSLERERWTVRQARKLIADKDWQQLMIDFEVNCLDPDFDFAEGGRPVKRPRSLASILAAEP